MDFSEYQRLSRRTSGFYNGMDKAQNAVMASMGLAGEAGELIDYLKKVVFHGREERPDKIVEELGDILWYLSEMASCYNLSLERVAELNVQKLEERYPDGFKKEGDR